MRVVHEVAPGLLAGFVVIRRDFDGAAEVSVAGCGVRRVEAFVGIERGEIGGSDAVEGAPDLETGSAYDISNAAPPLFVVEGEREAVVGQPRGGKETVAGAEAAHLRGAQVGAVGEVEERCHGRPFIPTDPAAVATVIFQAGGAPAVGGLETGLAPRTDKRQRGAVRANRPLIVWGALLLLAAAVYLSWSLRAVEIRGRVALRSWDGEVSVPDSAQALVFSRPGVKSALRKQLAAWPEARAAAKARGEQAREVWRGKVAAREEALRILRVAEKANAADLAACRSRHAEAEAAAQASFAELERSLADEEKLGDPAALIAAWRGALDGTRVAGDGTFVLRARRGQHPVLVVLVPAGPSGPAQAWVQPVEARGGVAEVELSNTNVLTPAALQEFAGVAAASGAARP